MNIALLIAGGSGNRMGQDIPKQFMHVDGVLLSFGQCNVFNNILMFLQ